MNRSIKYFESIEEVIEIHKKTIEVSGGGTDGIVNLSSLQTCLQQIQDDNYYPTFVDKLTHLVFVANKSHAFLDGNKRIAIALGMKFLLNNGYLYIIQKFAGKMESVSYHLAASRIDKDLLKEIIHSIIYEDDYSEELKLKIIKAYNTNE
ncbi:MAG TPA: type II toxin-antitoxin system death-on-curing family toxin [Dysgonamonadaceae bacterium]|nr:type II toxin-antitoxin system death-on-curing family toxin [Dysgonamonadaceae bacterium]MDD4606388.1 type II toxin-antitoxin system death-on-curing family toxin [Dysgonamonadaceae bacterium]HUI32482.1 type II toxin-antitoxin system death-on-curing family toxin [Dysgonamonadaceae bacterium]